MHTYRNQQAARPNDITFTTKRLQRVVLPSTRVTLNTPDSPTREPLLHYIAGQFQRQHNARITEFLPYLLNITCAGHISAAVGLRPAREGRLFVEHYFDHPAEQELSELFRTPVCRGGIVEIGNLVATRRGASLLLFTLLAAMLHRAGYRWIIFTATEQVGQIIRKLNFTPFTLCKAEKVRVANSTDNWGSYYETNPHVMVGDLIQAQALVEQKHTLCALITLYHNEIATFAHQLRRGAAL